MEPLDTFASPTASRPMLGLTVLVVEDSLYASEALRLLCLRSGARIRRADCLKSARRHLQVYRPSVAVVDLGLPDGSGAELIRELTRGGPKLGVVAAMSGDPGTEEIAREAGAQCFFAKPLTSLGAFQREILALMPPEYRVSGPRPVGTDPIEPDPVAYKDDMAHAAELLEEAAGTEMLAYLGQFLRGVAHCAGDEELMAAAAELDRKREAEEPLRSELAALAGLLQRRVGQRLAI
ncbi:response regulator receiver protein [Pseudooceanicola antarcticus]|uniref:Response regulator n=1 Tax=Pseudooceanicola antarcticus TaxID=1247613 RepID=A0A285IKQ7_9RHOB|nr:response regulator [Pseudooceanicola antarcticus]PJE28944.1 response regulator [Pseudooceanicola antarcticus]SNY47571.1 response regulator receiver protein [Pseudooceanicola antarcticus]